MKTLLLILACSLSLAAAAQTTNTATPNTDAPDNVRARFTTQHPTASPTWKADGKNYSAWFTDPQSNLEQVIVYDKDGHVIRKESQMDATAYPSGVSDYYTQNYPGEKDYKVWQSGDATGTDTYYYTKSNGKTLWFDKNGKYIKSPPKK